MQLYLDQSSPPKAFQAALVSSSIQMDPDFINVNVNGYTVAAQRTFSATGTLTDPSTGVAYNTTVSSRDLPFDGSLLARQT